MKIEYSKEADALYVYFREVKVTKSKEVENGVIVDFDKRGHVVGIEILDASKRLKPNELANVSVQNLPLKKAA